jgi:hypothetical protein
MPLPPNMGPPDAGPSSIRVRPVLNAERLMPALA